MAQRQHVRDLDRLARLAPGGTPDHPIPIETPPLVEVTVAAMRCPLCEGTLRLDEHAAETIDGDRLRIAHLTCTTCGVPREIYFRLSAPLLN
jgi:hypothetical protein